MLDNSVMCRSMDLISLNRIFIGIFYLQFQFRITLRNTSDSIMKLIFGKENIYYKSLSEIIRFKLLSGIKIATQLTFYQN